MNPTTCEDFQRLDCPGIRKGKRGEEESRELKRGAQKDLQRLYRSLALASCARDHHLVAAVRELERARSRSRY